MNEEKLNPQRTALNGNRGLRAIEAIKALCAGLDATEPGLVLKLLETVTAELKQTGKAA